MAQELNEPELCDILSPVIRSPVPGKTLAKIQERLHALITRDLGTRVAAQRLYLPLLEPLTELKSEPMWFPIWGASECSVSTNPMASTNARHQ